MTQEGEVKPVSNVSESTKMSIILNQHPRFEELQPSVKDKTSFIIQRKTFVYKDIKDTTLKDYRMLLRPIPNKYGFSNRILIH
jgi:hypothetical protein